MTKSVGIVGGGAAGMMAAYSAAKNGYQVTLFDKNPMLGKKVRITGKGRCNITNLCDREELISAFGENGSFLYGLFSRFDNYDLLALLDDFGLETKVERGNRVFPLSDSAHDVVKVFEVALKKEQVNLRFFYDVKEILPKEKGFTVIAEYTEKDRSVSKKEFSFDHVILATGGASYPLTGSTGEGYKIAEKLGHVIVTPRASLVPLTVKEDWIKDLQGLSLKNVTFQILDEEKNSLAAEFGEMLFTHFGISGPIVLTLSKIVSASPKKTFYGEIDLKPALDEKMLDSRLRKDFEKYHKKQFKNALNDLLPQKLIPVIVSLSRISPEKNMSEISKKDRTTLVELLKHFSFTITGTRPIAEAIVTAGGVSLKEVNPKTLESKKIKGLYFAGEILDIDAVTGGFNLQAAFTTGYVAGYLE